MRVAVGSGNPVKREATARVLGEFDGRDPSGGRRSLGDVTVESVPVPSGVAEQPVGNAETRAGAENRAAAAFAAGRYDLGVGIEGGVAEFRSADLFLVMWAAVTDGDRTGCGSGPSVRLPSRIAGRVRGGEELGPVMDDVLGTENVAKKQGAVGAFTGGRMSRTDALESAVTAAFAPFVSGLY
jgi:inosine/xanthosine triphosphatase